MLSDIQNTFTKEALDFYLKELAKEFRRLNGKHIPAEIILVGGASIVVNYGFRNMTTDVDAKIQASSAMKDAINFAGDKYHLPNGWLNTDFTKTASYSPEIVCVSRPYKTFYNLSIRTVSGEHLIAMKLRSGRKYKNDLSDIIGILAEHEKRGNPISFQQIDSAMIELYGSWDNMSEDSVKFIKDAMAQGNFEQIYQSIKLEEQQSKNILVDFENDYPNIITQANVDEILTQLKKRK